MEQETILKEVLHALKLHTEQINNTINETKTELIQRMDKMENRMDSMEDKMEKGLEDLIKNFPVTKSNSLKRKKLLTFYLQR